MKIKWLGHSCFLMTNDNGIKILTDPFDEKVGYVVPQEKADIVTVSHDHFDHNNISAVKGPHIEIREPGRYEVKEVRITGIPAYHDENMGARRGPNIIFVYDMDGIRVCHCGDLGHTLTEQQLDAIGNIDVLLIPIGGTYTVDGENACKVVRQLKPSVTIPMHFRTKALKFPLDGADSFFAAAGGSESLDRNELEITGENLRDLPAVIALGYRPDNCCNGLIY